VTLLLAALLSGPAAAAPAFTQILPLGVPPLSQGRPKPALLYGAPQALGGAASVWAITEMREASFAGDIDRELNLRLVSMGTVTFTAAFWFASVVEAANHAEQSQAQAQAAMAWQASRVELTSSAWER
jgi:hypothetical protein